MKKLLLMTFIAAIALLATIVVLFLMPETRPQIERRPAAKT